MKSKIESFLYSNYSGKYEISYEPTTLCGSSYSLTVDFSFNVGTNLYYLEYSGMNFFKKYLKLSDVCTHNQNVYVIFDDENFQKELIIFESLINDGIKNISNLSLVKIEKRIQNFYEEYLKIVKTNESPQHHPRL